MRCELVLAYPDSAVWDEVVGEAVRSRLVLTVQAASTHSWDPSPARRAYTGTPAHTVGMPSLPTVPVLPAWRHQHTQPGHPACPQWQRGDTSTSSRDAQPAHSVRMETPAHTARMPCLPAVPVVPSVPAAVKGSIQNGPL